MILCLFSIFLCYTTHVIQDVCSHFTLCFSLRLFHLKMGSYGCTARFHQAKKYMVQFQLLFRAFFPGGHKSFLERESSYHVSQETVFIQGIRSIKKYIARMLLVFRTVMQISGLIITSLLWKSRTYFFLASFNDSKKKLEGTIKLFFFFFLSLFFLSLIKNVLNSIWLKCTFKEAQWSK